MKLKNFSNISEKEKYVQIAMDLNRYAILIAIKENWTLELNKNLWICLVLKKTFLKKDITDLAKRRIWTKQNS